MIPVRVEIPGLARDDNGWLQGTAHFTSNRLNKTNLTLPWSSSFCSTNATTACMSMRTD